MRVCAVRKSVQWSGTRPVAECPARGAPRPRRIRWGAARLDQWVQGRLRVAGEAPRDVTSLLRAGGNALRLEVATSLNNALVTQGATGDPDYASYATRPLERSALIGPVRLVPFAEAMIPR